MTLPGFTAECAVSPTRGIWVGAVGLASGKQKGYVVPQQVWSRHCEQFGTFLLCCDCLDGMCFCSPPGVLRCRGE
jgi:hypothetical protein